MRKHIIGLAIFSFIVGTAIFIQSNSSGENYDYRELKVKSCNWRMKQKRFQSDIPQVSDSLDLKNMQAVLNLQTIEVSWKMPISALGTRIALHFFTKDAKGTKYIATEFAPYKIYSVQNDDIGNFSFTNSYSWLGKIKSSENLYVVPETLSDEEYKLKNFDFNFNESAAIPVLKYSGKID